MGSDGGVEGKRSECGGARVRGRWGGSVRRGSAAGGQLHWRQGRGVAAVGWWRLHLLSDLGLDLAAHARLHLLGGLARRRRGDRLVVDLHTHVGVLQRDDEDVPAHRLRRVRLRHRGSLTHRGVRVGARLGDHLAVDLLPAVRLDLHGDLRGVRHQAGRVQVKAQGIRLDQRYRGGEDHGADAVPVGHVVVVAFGDLSVRIGPVRADAGGGLMLHLLGRLFDPQLGAEAKESDRHAASAVKLLGKPVLPCAFHPLMDAGFAWSPLPLAESAAGK